MRQAFARSLQEGTENGLTNGEHIIRTLIQKAKDGDMKAIEYVLDRMGGRPLQSVEVGGAELSFSFLSEADRIRLMGSVERIKRMQADGDAKRQGIGQTLTLLPSTSECSPLDSASSDENPAIARGKKTRCIHGFAVINSAASHCVTCCNLGLQIEK
jgi:hypothetical protein